LSRSKKKQSSRRARSYQPNAAPLTPPPALAAADVDKVRAIKAQVAQGKLALGEIEVRYETERARVFAALAELDKRAIGIVTEAATSLGVGPDARFDWDRLAFVRPS
jgi:hypothetical protein